MKPTPEQVEACHQAAKLVQSYLTPAYEIAFLNHWESIRPKDQVTRTNHELARLLAEALEENNQLKIVCAHQKSTHQDLESVMQDYDKRGQQLKAALDEIERLNAPTVGPAEPLAFPDPPHGYTFHNPQGLTPKQVEIQNGWRLLVAGEARHEGFQDYCLGRWTSGGVGPGPISEDTSYRTKAPLPAPKPTPEQIERAEFEVWWNIDQVFRNNQEMAFGAWKAAKKGLTTP